MGTQSLVVLLLFLVLSVRMAMTIHAVRKRGGELYGKASITNFVVLFSKFAALFPVLLMVVHMAGVQIPSYRLPEFVQLAGILIMIIASGFLYLSLADLGKFTKMGLPKNDTIQLQTNGIYRFSRNPMYLGVILLTISSVLIVPNIISLPIGVTGIYLHHLIILKEEAFLEKKFGQRYSIYKKHTRRYL
ncbi:MAG: isoprenylcysteine carboxylmethyltransferase family protein [Bacteroidales bacterium]|nr:isoprenylcysteine carboxylmethyltransferase family protein [Bacteroidales bacterium]